MSHRGIEKEIVFFAHKIVFGWQLTRSWDMKREIPFLHNWAKLKYHIKGLLQRNYGGKRSDLLKIILVSEMFSVSLKEEIFFFLDSEDCFWKRSNIAQLFFSSLISNTPKCRLSCGFSLTFRTDESALHHCSLPSWSTLAASFSAIPRQCTVLLKTKASDPWISSAVYRRVACGICSASNI